MKRRTPEAVSHGRDCPRRSTRHGCRLSDAAPAHRRAPTPTNWLTRVALLAVWTLLLASPAAMPTVIPSVIPALSARAYAGEPGSGSGPGAGGLVDDGARQSNASATETRDVPGTPPARGSAIFDVTDVGELARIHGSVQRIRRAVDMVASARPRQPRTGTARPGSTGAPTDGSPRGASGRSATEEMRDLRPVTLDIGATRVRLTPRAPERQAASSDASTFAAATGQGAQRLQAGDQILMGDRFRTGADAALEMLFDENLRLRLAATSALRVLGRARILANHPLVRDGARPAGEDSTAAAAPAEPMDETRKIDQTRVELRRGAARVRISRNEVSPNQLLAMIRSYGVNLQYGDAILVNQEDGWAVLLGAGAAVLLPRRQIETGLGEAAPIRMRAGQWFFARGATAEGLPEVPRPLPLTQADWERAAAALPFDSTDPDRQRGVMPLRRESQLRAP